MSEQDDKDSKTEDPTEKRREEALDSGNTPVSREMANFGFALSIAAICSWMTLSACERIASVLSAFIERPDEFQLTVSADVSVLLRSLLVELAPALAPVPIILIIVAIFAHALQTPIRWSSKRLVPKISRISPSAGWQRIVSSTGLVELSKGLLKLGTLGAIAVWYFSIKHNLLHQAVSTPIQILPSMIVEAFVDVLVCVVIAAAAMAAGDIVFTRANWIRNLRMTKHEVRQEAKQSEGDQTLIHRRRSIARRRVQKMMITAAPRATLVVVNPTHFAVALRYERAEGNTPVVVAKGQDLLALQIRRIANEHDIPVVEDRGLARSLYAAVDVNQAIPQEFYAAVANILIMLRKIGNRRVLRALEG